MNVLYHSRMPSGDKKRLLQSHPLAVAVTVVVLLFLMMGLFALKRNDVPRQQHTTTFGANTGALQNPAAFSPLSDERPSSLPPVTSTATIQVPRGTATNAGPKPPSDADFQAFLTGLFNAPVDGSPSISLDTSFDAAMQNAYSYVPRGIITPVVTPSATPAQEALHRYGNEAGRIVKDFENTHTDSASVLSAQSKNRTDPQKAQELRDLGAAISGIGTDLLALKDVPEAARSANQTLAQSYQTAGHLLAAVADTGADDKKTLDAINTYTASVETLTRAYVGLITLFSLSDVSFTPGEAGSAFVFTNTASL
jgi:hypothetical protein